MIPLSPPLHSLSMKDFLFALLQGIVYGLIGEGILILAYFRVF